MPPASLDCRVSWTPAWVHVWPRKDTCSFSAKEEKKGKAQNHCHWSTSLALGCWEKYVPSAWRKECKGRPLRRFFLKKHGGRTRGNRHKLEHEKLLLDVSKDFKNESSQMLTRLEKKQKDCGNSVLGDIPNVTGQGPEQPALRTPALSSRLERRPPSDPSHLNCFVTLWFLCGVRTREQFGLKDTSGELWSTPWHLQGQRSHMLGFRGDTTQKVEVTSGWASWGSFMVFQLVNKDSALLKLRKICSRHLSSPEGELPAPAQLLWLYAVLSLKDCLLKTLKADLGFWMASAAFLLYS